MATYNGDRFVDEQLDSLARQTLPPAELVVSDDGSSDNTLEVICAFARHAPFPVRILPQHPRMGFADNFLFAAEHCSHELVAFCDQDDVWSPRKLQQAAERIEVEGSVLAMHPLILTHDNLVPKNAIWRQGITVNKCYAPLELDPYITGWGNTMLFRRELLYLIPRERRPLQPQDGTRSLSHDTWIYVLAAALGRVSHLLEPLIYYRQHGNNAMGLTPGPTSRLVDRAVGITSLQEFQFREQKKFYRLMADLFAGLARVEERDFGPQAHAAAERFYERAKYRELHLQTYLEPAFTARLRAFAALQCLPYYHSSLGSKFKALTLGVTGVEALRRQLGMSE